jgi:hypothetical protein
LKHGKYGKSKKFIFEEGVLESKKARRKIEKNDK